MDLTHEVANRGTGAGGANTNLYGKSFEEKTNNEYKLIEQGFVKTNITNKTKNDYYLYKEFEDRTTLFMTQGRLKRYLKMTYDIDICRNPDEAYIIHYKTGKIVVKILEKKHQMKEGSVETKLWSGPALKREYEIFLGAMFEVDYAFCLSDFFKKKFESNNDKKYDALTIILQESNIEVLFGDDDDYFDGLNTWINNS